LEQPVTPSQTIGPFFAVMAPLGSNELVPPETPGAIVINGRVFDGAGTPVSDAVVEIWQADAEGRYPHPDDPRYDAAAETRFSGFGRCHTQPDGSYSFVTLKPGRVAGWDERMQAPHISVGIFARGLLRRLATRIYFPDEEQANERDPVLSEVREPAVRETLIAVPEGPARLRFDIHLQGEKETAFFAV
jgi:protocatechuate 3,4-dioxygenase, alpha subunit